MKISVIVPTYKPQTYLWECLDSIYKQSFPKSEYELLLVLNGCNEPYNTQIESWLLKHHELQVQYIQTDEGGVSNARNIALDKAKGEYVTFIDDDDLISPKYLEKLYDKVATDTVSLCYPYAFNDGSIEKQLPYTITDAYGYCIEHKCNKLTSSGRKFFSGPCMKLIPMSFIQGRRYDVRFKNGEDSLFMFLISDRINKIAFTSKEAIYYRRYRTNSAASKKRGTWERIINNWKSIKEYTRIFCKGGYSCFFYFTRIVAETRGIILAPINSRKK